MDIVLSILQILGIILLVILGLLILVTLVLLFSPFRYRVDGNCHEATRIQLKLSWLCYLVRFRMLYEDELFYGEFSVPFYKKTFSYEIAKETEDEEKKDKPKKSKPKEKEKEPFLQKVKKKILHIKAKFKQLKRLVTDKRNHQALIHLKKELFYLIKILLPKKSYLKGEFSTGSPDTTGQVFGIIACFPIMYKDDFILHPDFTAEQAYFEGDFWGKGKIRLSQLVGMMIRIIWDENCRRLFAMVNRLLK